MQYNNENGVLLDSGCMWLVYEGMGEICIHAASRNGNTKKEDV